MKWWQCFFQICEPGFLNMKKTKIEFYYIPFNATTGLPMRISTLKRKPYLNHLSLNEDDFRLTKNALTNSIGTAKFDESFLRLIAIIENLGVFYVDSDGRVRHNGKSYYISPGSFLWLFIFLSRHTEYKV